jgi:exosortase/archaeosortase family protein
MKLSSIKLPKRLKPYKGVIIFAVILMGSNIFWKYNVLGDESANPDSTVTFWGLDISAPFIWTAHHVAHSCEAILHFIGSKVTLEPDNSLLYANGNSVQVIWACTGLKQAYIFFCIIAFYRGSWLKKLWYIPLGLVLIHLFNIFRITFITFSIENHPNWFDFLHQYFFKYVFYGLIFLMWVLWEERIAQKCIIKEKRH